MRAEMIDPRDATEEVDRPTYRAIFYACATAEEWRLSDAGSVLEALAWVQQHARGRGHGLWAEYPASHGGVGLALLAGQDPFLRSGDVEAPVAGS
ncbi:hypothetical protein Cch01nite_34300 [Cellulomonas chitinilytica]|uniref:Uncharacterized protein n=1 Tax=Cellulomonas chitinilytica TaxID=398759 RepID=A0A919P3F2_9CELL|nr:hypothetical protein [Cellulomonas chitinilytica]GIG22706.1 hypothetical protein Cch01nite_34300 [Cellulomonas chitinilytica]